MQTLWKDRLKLCSSRTENHCDCQEQLLCLSCTATCSNSGAIRNEIERFWEAKEEADQEKDTGRGNLVKPPKLGRPQPKPDKGNYQGNDKLHAIPSRLTDMRP